MKTLFTTLICLFCLTACTDDVSPRDRSDEDDAAIDASGDPSADTPGEVDAPIDNPWDDLPSGLDARPANVSCIGTNEAPRFISETGCFSGDPARPNEALIPYDLQAPLWSDAADKTRYIALPDGAQMTIRDDGDMELPPGGVSVKSFALGGRLLETRFVVRDELGIYHAYAYEWNEQQSDAELRPDGAEITVTDETTWTVPSDLDCLSCHTDSARISLGLEVGQLNRDFTYETTGREANQLATWQRIGLFDGVGLHLPDELTRYPAYGSDASAAERARAYLHSNCSHCHRPGALGAGRMDMRFDVPFVAMALCNAVPESGDPIESDNLFMPGEPDESILYERVRTIDPVWRMPPLARELEDPEGSALVHAWIESVSGCGSGE